jgi:predicted membrane-bound spermidine synthase
VLLLLAFTGGVVSLGIEISASRLLAPFFGTSTPIWGALIGLILLYLTLGYYLGGWAADRWPRADYLYGLTALAAGLTLLIPLVSRPILLLSVDALRRFDFGPLTGALIAVILLFAPAVILLGMISPWVIRLRTESVAVAGRRAGGVYAISTAGSILGAFLPAFWWIPSYGTRATIYGLGGLLAVVSLLGLARSRGRGAALAGAACLVPLLGALLPFGTTRPLAEGQSIYESDSEYGYIQVQHLRDANYLILNEGQAVHSVYDPGRVLTGRYWDFFDLAPLYGNPRWNGERPRRALIIGLAGGTVARELTAAYGAIPIDGVEIDPRIIDVGRRYFDMNEPNLQAIAADGRYFLRTTDASYDLVAVDAYRQPYIPFQLTTKEFFQECSDHLGLNGVVAVNVARAPDDYRLVDAITGTMAAVFPAVYRQDTPSSLNTMVYGTKSAVSAGDVAANFSHPTIAYPPLVAQVIDEADAGGERRLVAPHGPVYTDDLAPVERLIDSILFRFVSGH